MGYLLSGVQSHGGSPLLCSAYSLSSSLPLFPGSPNLLGKYFFSSGDYSYNSRLWVQMLIRFSPSYSWLMAHNEEVEALQVLAALEGKPVNDPYISTIRNEIGYSIHFERENAVGWLELMRWNSKDSTKTTRRLLLAAGTQFMQQFQGINIMSYYLPTVLMNSVGLSDSLARLLTACNSVSYFVFTCLSVPLVEKCGRRGLMLMSTFGQFLSFLTITILLRFASSQPTGSNVASASIAFFFLFYISFGMGMLGVPWLYPTEISSLPMRTKSAAVATATNWYSI